MQNKINENIERGRYSQKIASRSFGAFRNKNGGWVDFLLSDSLIFSHRINDYTVETFPEQLDSHEYFELTVNRAGEGMQYIADGQYAAFPSGCAILTKPDAMHMFRATLPIEYDRYVIYFKSPERLFPDRAALGFTKAGNAHNAIFLADADRMLSLVASVERELEALESPFANARALLRLTELFILLSERGSSPSDAIIARPSELVCELKQYIDDNAVNIHSVTELAERFSYSREYLTRSFRSAYNTSLYEYIIRRKLLKSCALLRSGASVERAAGESGFRNMSSFIKTFKKHRGCTPSEWKMSQ